MGTINHEGINNIISDSIVESLWNGKAGNGRLRDLWSCPGERILRTHSDKHLRECVWNELFIRPQKIKFDISELNRKSKKPEMYTEPAATSWAKKKKLFVRTNVIRGVHKFFRQFKKSHCEKLRGGSWIFAAYYIICQY